MTTILFFALIEGLLALGGAPTLLESGDPFVGFDGSSPLFVERLDAANAAVMQTADNKRAYFNFQTFPREKPAGTVRIFCLGGSTTYGHPYDDTTSFAGWLRELLPLAKPDTNWEVINAGGISYASYRVAHLMEELVSFQPDLFIVYTGQNEFLEERTYRDLKARPAWAHWLKAAASRSRTVSLAERVLAPLRSPPPARYQLAGEVDAVLDHTSGPASYSRDDLLRRQIVQHFELNLARMIALADSAGAGIVFVLPASKAKDCSPFKSQHRDLLASGELQKWEAYFERGKLAAQEGQREAALEAWDAAARIDDRFAELHFLRGEALFELGRYAEATAAFDRAIDEDVCPLRVVTEIREALERLAGNQQALLIDFTHLLKSECLRRYGHNALGEEFFLDHVHPTIEATGTLAVALVQEMTSAGLIDLPGSLSEEQIEIAERRIRSRIDPAAHAVALRNLAKVLNWSGKHYEAGPLALKALEVLPDDPESLYLSAAYLKMTGKVDQAIDYYRRAVRQMPNYAEAHQFLGAALVERREFDEALVHFREVVRIHPEDPDGHHMIGAILAEREQFDDALPHYRRALGLSPNDANLHYNMAFTLDKLNRTDEAMSHYRRTLELNPHDADAHERLGQLLLRLGRSTEANEHFREAARLRPDSSDAGGAWRLSSPA